MQKLQEIATSGPPEFWDIHLDGDFSVDVQAMDTKLIW